MSDDKSFVATLEMLVPQLLQAIMEKNGWAELDTMYLLYSSMLYRTLEREDTKLWCLSVPTLLDLFEEEQRSGKITFPEEA